MTDTAESQAEIRSLLERAVEHHTSGRLTDAAELYLQVLALDPGQADALHLTGVVAHQLGKHELAVQFICEAITRDADQPAFYNNLGNALIETGNAHDAGLCYERALALNPGYAMAWLNAASLRESQGDLAAAGEFRSRALELDPSLAA